MYEVSKDATRRRSETYDKLRIAFDGEEFAPVYDALDNYAQALKPFTNASSDSKGDAPPISDESTRERAVADNAVRKLSPNVRRGFAASIEHIALVTKSGLISYTLANYEFGYYAILCWDCEPFWHDLEQNTPYWALYAQPSPHFSHNRECLSERSVLIQIFAKSRNEWPQTGLRHVWDQLIEHASLPEQ